jgi:hypothetical protein
MEITVLCDVTLCIDTSLPLLQLLPPTSGPVLLRNLQPSSSGHNRLFFCPEDGGSRFRRNTAIDIPDYTVSYLRRQKSSSEYHLGPEQIFSWTVFGSLYPALVA